MQMKKRAVDLEEAETRIGEINERMRSGLRLGERELIQEYALPSTCTSS